MTNSIQRLTCASDPLDALLESLKRSGLSGFSAYQPPTLLRRAAWRMSRLGITDFRDYGEFLARSPAERADLSRALWINQTAFFRDGPVWDRLGADVLPALLARRAPGEPVRVWCAGCASGEEAYSLAMAVAEAGGRARIVATDVDGEALDEARRGVYAEWAMARVAPARRERFFERIDGRTDSGGGWRVRGGLRRGVSFRRQDLLRVKPAGAFDLISCRNTLMYFRRDAQARVLGRLRRALADGGYLLLGQPEGTISYDAGRTLEDNFGVAHAGGRFYTRRPLFRAGGN